MMGSNIHFIPLFAVCLVCNVFAQEQDARHRQIKELKGVPGWLGRYEFPQKEFTFVRIQYDSSSRRVGRGRWATDYPEADLNLSTQLAKITSFEVPATGKVMRLTDADLPKFPFVYLSEPGSLLLSDKEAEALRTYLRGGGFLMVDDFWGEREWDNLSQQLEKVFPMRKPVELNLDHAIFHCVFDLKEKPQVPSIHTFLAGARTERHDARDVHYKALFDHKGRMMAILCHNTDLADGWERADVDERYYREHCEQRAYPMAINIIFYALTQKTMR